MGNEPRGGCQCGAVRYRLEGSVPAAYACHCGECKKQSASAFSMSLPIKLDRLHVTGELSFHETRTFNGQQKLAFFCPACGVRLWHRATTQSNWVTLKVGTLDNAEEISPRGHLWVSKKQPWIIIPEDVQAFDTQPDDVQSWRVSLSSDNLKG